MNGSFRDFDAPKCTNYSVRDFVGCSVGKATDRERVLCHYFVVPANSHVRLERVADPLVMYPRNQRRRQIVDNCIKANERRLPPVTGSKWRLTDPTQSCTNQGRQTLP